MITIPGMPGSREAEEALRCGNDVVVLVRSEELRFQLVHQFTHEALSTVSPSWALAGAVQAEFRAYHKNDTKLTKTVPAVLIDDDLHIFSVPVPPWSDLYFRLVFPNQPASIPGLSGFQFDTLQAL